LRVRTGGVGATGIMSPLPLELKTAVKRGVFP